MGTTLVRDSATALTTTYAYKANTAMMSTITMTNAAGDVGKLQYNYDSNGNISSVAATTGGVTTTTTYTYDTAGQLVRENNQKAGTTTLWTYDNAGNILTEKVYAYTTGTPTTLQKTNTYSYTSTQWGDLLTAYNGNMIYYDGLTTLGNFKVGNPTTYNNGTAWTFTWEHGRQLATMTTGSTTWTNTYNSDGLRTSRTDGTTTYTYYYEEGRLSAIKRNDLNMWIIYDENGPVTLKYGVGTFHYVTNLQGDVVAIVGANGQKLVEYTYDAWGKVLSITGDYAYNLGIHNPILYRGYIYDHETGFYYCQSRYYDPETGRFLNADAFASTGQGLLGNNMFAYCGNNPVNYSDPSGLAFLPCVTYFDGEGGGYPIWTNLAYTPEEQTRGMINGQGRLPYSSNSIGLGSYGYSGCPYIAVYNAMQLMGNARSLHSITQDFLYKHGVVLFGAWGAGPWNIESYIKSEGINYTSSSSVSDLTANISEGSVIIFTVWNDRSDITAGWHAMTALYAKGQYWVFNQYNNSTTYAVFPSLEDAFTEGMWLHGIRID